MSVGQTFIWGWMEPLWHYQGNYYFPYVLLLLRSFLIGFEVFPDIWIRQFFSFFVLLVVGMRPCSVKLYYEFYCRFLCIACPIFLLDLYLCWIVDCMIIHSVNLWRKLLLAILVYILRYNHWTFAFEIDIYAF